MGFTTEIIVQFFIQWSLSSLLTYSNLSSKLTYAVTQALYTMFLGQHPVVVYHPQNQVQKTTSYTVFERSLSRLSLIFRVTCLAWLAPFAFTCLGNELSKAITQKQGSDLQQFKNRSRLITNYGNPRYPQARLLTDILGRPRLETYLVLLPFLYCLIKFSNSMQKLKACSFYLSVVASMVIRCLSYSSGCLVFHFLDEDNPSIVAAQSAFSFAMTFWKFPLLLVFVYLWLWRCTYLGRYSDWYHDQTLSIARFPDRHGFFLYRFKPNKKQGDTLSEEDCQTKWGVWKDLAIRLSYLTLVTNTAQILWSLNRYFFYPMRYTHYVNDSEILTLVLAVSLGMYTYARMHSHHAVLYDPERFCYDFKLSVTEGLFERSLLNPYVEPGRAYKAPEHMDAGTMQVDVTTWATPKHKDAHITWTEQMENSSQCNSDDLPA
ncbi:hypothetical protein GQ43DRAFT_476446 [Delitschia confertaspora ATCC 74209]|uniref:Uncharacterized protein n=1 Tax=Delitschia confertaspora ATCC 74209 TaxID=1513339 RepID=A0A9P4JGX4_9PLEO|nr:hypothetical protein GQ43DRAFT_476446 [Delitschia confertaspora ATCC 74209]